MSWSVRRAPGVGSDSLSTAAPSYCALVRYREAAFAAVAMQSSIADLALDCFAMLAMTATLLSLNSLWRRFNERAPVERRRAFGCFEDFLH
jgi:hypothetical protein